VQKAMKSYPDVFPVVIRFCGVPEKTKENLMIRNRQKNKIRSATEKENTKTLPVTVGWSVPSESGSIILQRNSLLSKNRRCAVCLIQKPCGNSRSCPINWKNFIKNTAQLWKSR